jgi:hypothetical protein
VNRGPTTFVCAHSDGREQQSRGAAVKACDLDGEDDDDHVERTSDERLRRDQHGDDPNLGRCDEDSHRRHPLDWSPEPGGLGRHGQPHADEGRDRVQHRCGVQDRGGSGGNRE